LRVKDPTFTLVGILVRGPRPGPVEVVGSAALALPARGVVSALAAQLALGPRRALGRVSVALAAPADGEVRDRVVAHGQGGHRRRGRRRQQAVGAQLRRHHVIPPRHIPLGVVQIVRRGRSCLRAAVQ